MVDRGALRVLTGRDTEAARALLDSDLAAEAIVRKGMAIASEICVYTNNNLVIETIGEA